MAVTASLRQRADAHLAGHVQVRGGVGAIGLRRVLLQVRPEHPHGHAFAAVAEQADGAAVAHFNVDAPAGRGGDVLGDVAHLRRRSHWSRR